MKIIERYSAAVNSDNLAIDPRSTWGDSDVLGAAGLAARRLGLGVALARFLAGGKAQGVIEVLEDMAWAQSLRLHVKITRVQATDVSKAVLAWYRYGICQPCGGTGFQVIPNTPSLGDECKHCHGTGRIPFDSQFPEKLLGIATWLGRAVECSQAEAGNEAMRLIAPRLDL